MRKASLNQLITGLAILYPVVVHLSVYFHVIFIALSYFAVLLTLLAFDVCFKRSVTLMCVIILVIASLLVISLQFSSIFILYLPPIVISLGLFYGFANSLRSGNTALITRIAAQIYQAEFTRELADYTRSCTVLWSIIMGILTLETIVLALFAPVEIWSLFCNILNYLFLSVCFIIEYIYRIYRFGSKIALMTYIKMLININWVHLIKRPS